MVQLLYKSVFYSIRDSQSVSLSHNILYSLARSLAGFPFYATFLTQRLESTTLYAILDS